MITTIQISKDLKEKLELLKVHHRETYNELILRLIGNSSTGNESRESLIATVEVLSNTEDMRDIAGALEEIQKGNYGKPFDEIKKEVGI